METPTISINDVHCPAADQLADALANLAQLEFLVRIHEMRLRTAAYEAERKRAQRSRRHPIETRRPPVAADERLTG